MKSKNICNKNKEEEEIKQLIEEQNEIQNIIIINYLLCCLSFSFFCCFSVCFVCRIINYTIQFRGSIIKPQKIEMQQNDNKNSTESIYNTLQKKTLKGNI